MKTSEKAYASDPSRMRVCGCIVCQSIRRQRSMAHARMWVIPFAGACASARCRVVILVDLGPLSFSPQSLFSMDKVCPQCSTAVNVRRAVCGCGHAFPSKRKAQPGNMQRSTVQCKKTNARASETSEQTLNRRDMDQVRKTRKRASETSEQTLNRMLVQCL